MTPWSGWQAHRVIEALVSNPDGGEAEKGALVATAFGSFVERVEAYTPDAFEVAVRSVVASIVEAQPASAPLLTLANAVLLAVPKGPEVVVAEVRSVAERLRTSVGILGAMGAAFVPDGGSVLAHGTSSSVRRVLEEAAMTKEFRAVCEPGFDGSGGLFATELSDAGIVVEMIDDDFIVESLLGVDLVVTGAFAFGPTAMINTPGTRLIADEAAKVDRRVLLISSADKALPAPLFDRAAGVAGEHDLEIVPLGLFEAVVTELGVLDPVAAGRLADRREVAPELA